MAFYQEVLAKVINDFKSVKKEKEVELDEIRKEMLEKYLNSNRFQ